MKYLSAFKESELWDGEMKGVKIAGHAIVVIRQGGAFFAYEDRCAHQGVPLSEGSLECPILTCRVHGWSYDVHTGIGLNPKGVCLRRYPTKCEDGVVLIGIEEEGMGRAIKS